MLIMLLYFLLSLTVPVLVMAIFIITSMRSNLMSREKSSPFECGFDPHHTSRIPFSMRFFLLAIIFIVFDIEIVLLMPIPMTMSMSPQILIGSQLFLLILIIGLFHEWNQGSLNWSEWDLFLSF